MRTNRVLSWILTLCLLVAPLSVTAESGGLTSAQKDTAAALQIDVEYDQENAEWDGKLQARVKVSWNGTDGSAAAEDVHLWLETSDGLTISKGEYELELGDLEAGAACMFGIELAYDSSYERADYTPEPTLNITAAGSNTDYTLYTGRLDGTTEPRMLVLGWEQLGEVPRAVQTDLDIVTAAFSKSYYNKRPFQVESHPCDGGTFESLISAVERWQDDANDITYIYINAHGAVLDGVPLPAFFAETEKESVWIGDEELSGKGIVTYRDMLAYLEEHCKGRVVIITDICYSGFLITTASDLDLSMGKYALFTATDRKTTSPAWPDGFNLSELEPLGTLLGFIDLPVIMLPFSYGWFTNDLCDLLDAGYAEDENGVVTVSDACNYLNDVLTAVMLRLEAKWEDKNRESFSLDGLSGMDDVFDGMDYWYERISGLIKLPGVETLLNEMNPLDVLRQIFVMVAYQFNPICLGLCDAPLYCSNPEYDDGRRLLTVIEETVEYRSGLEMYYDYLREQVMPEIGMARRDEAVIGERRFDAAYWADVMYDQCVSGLLSAAVCDLDKNGSLDMITLTVTPRDWKQIKLSEMYYSVNLDMYQIENGRVVRSDSREDILYINQENFGIWSHMRCWMVDYNDRIGLRASCYSSAGNSDEWTHTFSCSFQNGRIVDGAESVYLKDHVIKTQEGDVFNYSDWGYGYYNHMGSGVAFIEVYSGNGHEIYYAFDYTNLYEYIYGYAEPEEYVPLKLVAVPVQALPVEEKTPIERRDEVQSGVGTAIEAAMRAEGKEAYAYYVSCSTETGEATQFTVYSNLTDYSAVDTEKLRSMALAALESPVIAAPEEVLSAMRSFEFAEKSHIEKSAGTCRIQLMMIPDGTYCLVLDLGE